MKLFLPMNLQLFAEPAPAAEEGTPPTNQAQSAAPSFDYDKLASIISGKQSVAEDTILKNFFKQQGMSKEELDQAIQTFKDQKAEKTPDVAALQSQAKQAQALAEKAQIEAKAQIVAIQLGVEPKVLPYLMKMADLSQITLESKDEDITNALNKVLEDVPALKTQTTAATGFKQIGSGGQSQQQNAQADALARAFGNK